MSSVNGITATPGGALPPESGQGRQPTQRIWRVGSLSMGITLMLMGTALAVSIWQDAKAYELLLWVAPIVFILLGAELLLHLKLSGSRHTMLRYDWMSVFFVGCIGFASLVLAFLMSTGLFDQFKAVLQTTQRTVIVNTDKITVPGEIKKIVVQAVDSVTIEESDSREAQLMGQIRYWSAEPNISINQDIMQTKIVGTTMYFIIGSMDRRDGGLVTDTIRPMLILSLPNNVEVQRYFK
ncbi:hypothetical protein [Paenibacillus sp. HB172176]|uniref:hypothetical protein n=1 Tax=Paenibacillus sp. HB172176 TaxID=2493690 RepID=UPI0014389E78|nr:hypothetical protein [Paenibacillus sp. HB172176]